ncbi:hypothetical protein HYC85_000755 [Camellia sinensis]|uniref:NPH3 domain-containing protein n=1 Tax=Camellia sinensis TaxID=4442 RepID=A0A7J7I4X3_CAMSI|nr:hypothetical protein HYC85_000755 [Camellia sinensis]
MMKGSNNPSEEVQESMSGEVEEHKQGICFTSKHEVYAFYAEYAKHLGFAIPYRTQNFGPPKPEPKLRPRCLAHWSAQNPNILGPDPSFLARRAAGPGSIFWRELARLDMGRAEPELGWTGTGQNYTPSYNREITVRLIDSGFGPVQDQTGPCCWARGAHHGSRFDNSNRLMCRNSRHYFSDNTDKWLVSSWDRNQMFFTWMAKSGSAPLAFQVMLLLKLEKHPFISIRNHGSTKFARHEEFLTAQKCRAEYLQMNEDYGEKNLIAQTESLLDEVFGNWADTINALETCEEVLPHAEELHIVSRCIDSLAIKACADPSLFNWPVSGCNSMPHPVHEDWWYEDVSFLRLHLFKRLILIIGSRGMKPDTIARSVLFYAKKHLPLMGRQSSFDNGNHAASGSNLSVPSNTDQRTLLEEIVTLLPDEKGITPTKLLLRLLRTSMILNASRSCQESLEKRVGAQLNEARILDHFMLVGHDTADSTSNGAVDEGQLMEGSHSLTPMTMLAAVIPDYARPLDDGIYRAIDIYLKAHPWLTDSEREQICRLMDCQKLSLEASTHAAQNERLPLRVIVQVLFFEQLRLRTSVAGWFFVSDNLENSQNQSGNISLPRNDHSAQEGCGEDGAIAVDDVRERVFELEKECSSMKQEIETLVKTKGSWNSFCRRFGINRKLKSGEEKEKASSKSCNVKVSPPSTKSLQNGNQNLAKDELGD